MDTTTSDDLFLSRWKPPLWRRLLAHFETRRFIAGQMVIQAGATDRALYLITKGAFEVFLPNGRRRSPRRLAVVQAGSVIGEQAFLDGRPRSASVRAETDSEALCLSPEAFEVFASRNPELARDILFDLGRIVSLRLRETQKHISSWIG